MCQEITTPGGWYERSNTGNCYRPFHRNNCGTNTRVNSTVGREILREGYPLRRIDITGYVTERLTSYSFAIKVTGDSVERLSLSNLQVSKEVRIAIPPYLYPLDDNSKFIRLTARDDPRTNDPCIDQINKCLSFGSALSKGDQIECSVFIVEEDTRAINRNRKDIETYADFDLWLYPNNGYFRRSVSDSRESLKFRKQWRYMCINREKCKKITGQLLNKYRDKWWINKNPKMIFPMLWWMQVKTTCSNLLQKASITNIITIIGAVVTIIGAVVAILFR